MKAVYFGDTNVGRARTNNEDNLIAQQIWNDKNLLFAAIDGIGGYEGGEVAAEIARNSIVKYLNDFPNGKRLDLLKQSVVDANNEIMRYKTVSSKHSNMGCVLTTALIELEKEVINVAHVGDTRLYQYHNGEFRKLTHDHSLVGYREEIGELTEEEAMHHPQRNVLERYLGETPHMLEDKNFLEAGIFPILPGSQLLLCSDGLCDMVTSVEMCNILAMSISVEEKVNRLIATANKNGGKDNITVVVVQFDEVDDKAKPLQCVDFKDLNKKIPKESTVENKTNRTQLVLIAFSILASLLIGFCAGGGYQKYNRFSFIDSINIYKSESALKTDTIDSLKSILFDIDPERKDTGVFVVDSLKTRIAELEGIIQKFKEIAQDE